MLRAEIFGEIVRNDDKWIYDWLEIDSVCPKDVRSVLDNANGQSVDVFISSPGGDLFSGAEIYSALRDYAGAVRIHVVGTAGSAASLILCAGESDISPAGTVMIHNVSIQGASGDHHDMEHIRNTLIKLNESVAIAYEQKTGKSRSELLTIMDKATWLNAEDAVELGIVDSIAAPQLQYAASTAMAIPPLLLEKIKNVLKDPRDTGDSLLREKAQAQLNLLKMGGKF